MIFLKRVVIIGVTKSNLSRSNDTMADNFCSLIICIVMVLAVFMKEPSSERSYSGTPKEPYRIVLLLCQERFVREYCDKHSGGNSENHTTCTNSFMKKWLVYPEVWSPRLRMAFKECRDYKGKYDEVNPYGCECICVRAPRRTPRHTISIRSRTRSRG